MDSELILHHYDFSSFSEKVRLVLGMKNLSWRSVDIPSTLPKPDYLPLTGGYRRAPSLQIGANVYCDSKRIIEELEQRYPEPSIYPGPRLAQRAFTAALERWTDSILLRTTINYISSAYPEGARFTAEFLNDRAELLGKAQPGLGHTEANAAKNLAQLRPQLRWIADMLDDGRLYVHGDAMSLADCVIYHAIWIMDQLAYRRVALIPDPVRRWMDRIAARGHGKYESMSALEALDIAADATPLPAAASEILEGDPAAGEMVSVMPIDTGRLNSTVGRLTSIDAMQVTVAHRNDRVGEVAVHFPRLGYRVRPAGA
ncbi:MAG: glutathione S-transferase family protein [Candidatus Binataceae bacterium]